jgi:hypothetical protein
VVDHQLDHVGAGADVRLRRAAPAPASRPARLRGATYQAIHQGANRRTRDGWPPGAVIGGPAL